MDGLSAAATVLQLADSIQKIVKFCRAVQKAPSDFSKLCDELQELSQVLTETRATSVLVGNDTREYVIIQNCQTKISNFQRKLAKSTAHLNSGKSSVRIWSAIKAVLKEPEFRSLREDIERTKSSLTLLIIGANRLATDLRLQSQDERLYEILNLLQNGEPKRLNQQDYTMQIYDCKQDGCMQTNFVEIPTMASEPEYNSLQDVAPRPQYCKMDLSDHRCTIPTRALKRIEESNGSTRFILPTPVLSIYKRTRSRKVTTQFLAGDHTSIEGDLDFVIAPNHLLRKIGLSYGLSFRAKSTNSWQFSIQMFTARPDNHLMFEFCRSGNLEGVQKMLSLGQASLQDRDSSGRTPLRIATGALQLDIAEFLLRQGADPYACDWKKNFPPIYGIRENNDIAVNKKLSMVTLFRQYSSGDFEENDIYQLIGSSIMSYRPHKSIGLTNADAGRAALLLSQELCNFLPPMDDLDMSKMLFGFLQYYYSNIALRWCISRIRGNIQEDWLESEGSAIHGALKRKLLHRDPISTVMIARKSQSLHRELNYDRYKTPVSTPTTFTMYQPEMFYRWVQLLRSISYDLEQFIADELSVSSVLLDQGWTQETLSVLFHSEPIANSVYSGNGFYICDRCSAREAYNKTKVDLAWRRHLRNIRTCRWKPETVRRSNEMDVNISYDFEESDGYVGELFHLSEQATHVVRTVPLMVCSGECQDGICVANVYENDLDEEPDITPYPLLCEELDIEDDTCPARNMPGAFVS